MEDLSIIIPTYKRHQSLARTLQSLKSQKSDLTFEILIIDQNVPGFLAKHLSPDLLEICTIIQQEKPNVSAARNKGYAFSKSDILLFMDDDLVADPTFLQKVADLFRQNSFIHCLSPLIYSQGKKNDELKNRNKDIKGHKENLFVISNPISAAFFVRKSTYEKVGGFDPFLFDYCKSTEDNEFFIRLQKHGEKIYYDPSLDILHEEEIEGGCELRKSSFLENRLKFIKGWSYRYRIHNGGKLKLTWSDYFRLLRSTVLNKNLIKLPLSISLQLLKLLIFAIKDSKKELNKNNLKNYYSSGWKTNHLKLSKD